MDPNEESTDKDTSPSIGREVTLFVDNIKSLAETIDPMMFIVQSIRKDHNQKIEEFEEKCCEVEMVEDSKYVSIPADHFYQFQKLISQMHRYALADKLI